MSYQACVYSPSFPLRSGDFQEALGREGGRGTNAATVPFPLEDYLRWKNSRGLTHTTSLEPGYTGDRRTSDMKRLLVIRASAWEVNCIVISF